MLRGKGVSEVVFIRTYESHECLQIVLASWLGKMLVCNKLWKTEILLLKKE